MQYGGASNGAETAVKKMMKPFSQRRFKRMNVIAICAALFIPWIIGCGTVALWSFSFHYRNPSLFFIVCSVFGGSILILWLSRMYRYFKSDEFEVQTGILSNEDYHPELLNQHQAHEEMKAGSWSFFILTMSLFFFVTGTLVGRKNFQMNTQPYYDLTNLNTYTEVNPETVRGQELMDAGLVQFTGSVSVDLKRIMSFRNMETYCVAPISVAGVPLQSYDFWAVGLGCCGDGLGSNFTCGAVDQPFAHGGVRVMRNEDRAFYRLAVQQAQSAYNIRANHPLFFYWSLHPKIDAHMYLTDGFRKLFVFMYGGFLLQVLLVLFVGSQFNPVKG